MLSADDYRAYAAVARVMAAEYRVEAITEKEPRKSMLLKWAVQREEDSAFYESRALIAEDVEARKAQKEAA